MNYTESNAFVIDSATGNRMHQDTAPVTTEVSAKDMNMMIWSLMEVIKAAGLIGTDFDVATPASYQRLLQAFDSRYVGPGHLVDRGLVSVIDVMNNTQIQDGQAGVLGFDATPMFQEAVDSLGPRGGTITYPGNVKFLLDTDLYIKPNVTLRGSMSRVGSPKDNTQAAYEQVGALVLNPAARIILRGGAGLDGGLVYRKGMTFPATDAALFAGRAFEVGGDDAFIVNSMVLGFDELVYSTGYQRFIADYVNGDCNTGIYLRNCLDIAKIHGCHMWPFATIAATGPASRHHRSGAAYLFELIGDWNKVTDSFSYGHAKGFVSASVNSMTYSGCGADNTGVFVGAKGFEASGTTLDVRYGLCQAAAQDIGFDIALEDGKTARMLGCDTWGNLSRGTILRSGTLMVRQGIQRNVPVAIEVASGTAVASIDDVQFNDITVAPINVTVANSNVHIGDGNDYGNWPTATAVTNNVSRIAKNVASASTLMLANRGKFFIVLGDNDINFINAGWAEREITLQFTGTLTVAHGALFLKGGISRAVTPGASMRLVHNGTAWLEV